MMISNPVPGLTRDLAAALMQEVPDQVRDAKPYSEEI